MQIPILSGIYTDDQSDYRTAYPRNMIPVPVSTGISAGYLRPSSGIVQLGVGPGVDRGGINWNGQYYRVLGEYLCGINPDGSIFTIGSVGGVGQVTMVYSFDYLAIASGGKLFLCNKTLVLKEVTDSNLGACLDVEWVDGYFMSTDGENVVVTELLDPFSVNTFAWESSDIDPDPITALVKLRNEIYVLNRYTIEVFENIGTPGLQFPFDRIDGAQIYRGCVGAHSCCVFADSVAFLGGGRNESTSIWLGLDGSSAKLSTREIDKILEDYSTDQLEDVVFETRIERGHNQLWVRLPDQTLVYDGAASKEAERAVWFTLTSSLKGKGQYLAQNIVHVYGRVMVGNPAGVAYGYLADEISSHYGEEVGWEFSTEIVYNEGYGVIFHELELVGLPGRSALGDESVIMTSYSNDGETWSIERPVSTGTIGQRNKRLTWFQQGHMTHQRMQRFRGTSKAHMSFSRLEARLEQLGV